MRTTLAIDDDILIAAKQLAERDGKTIGEVISALAREGLSDSPRAVPPVRNGIKLLPVSKNARPVTLKLVNRLRDEQQ
jgi:hypothetical protein